MSAFISNVFVNSLMTFFTAVLIVETLLFIFRLRQGRVTSFLRIIPILKLPLDLFFYDFSRWSYTYGINPLLCEQGSRSLTAILGWANSLFLPYLTIEFNVYGNKTFTIADILNYFISTEVLNFLMSALVLTSLFLVVRKICIYYTFHTELTRISNGRRVVVTPLLNGSPFVCGVLAPVVYIPHTLSQTLTPEEYNAVLEHEEQHLIYKDNLIRMCIDFICTAFWWIPTKGLRRRIVDGQEAACDQNCLRRGVEPVDLASALYKSAKDAVAHRVSVPSMAQGRIQNRIHMILDSNDRFHRVRQIGGVIALVAALTLVLFARLWIF